MMRIRRATSGDATAIATIHFAAVHESAKAFYSEDVLNGWSVLPGELQHENVRQAIVDFPRQYLLAGRVCGMKTSQIVRYIQLPILFRQLLPTLLILQVGMLHASLFASLISVEEIFRVAQRINSTIYRPIELYTALAMFFLLVCLPINLLAAYLKQRYTRDFSER